MYDRLPPLPAFVDRNPMRRRLLLAAADVVVEHGYERVSARDIATRAGVTLHTFYEFFESKEDGVLAAYDAFVARLSDYSRAAVAHIRPASRSEEVRVRIAALLAMARAEPGLAQLAFLEIAGAGPVAAARYEQTLAGLGLQAPELVVGGLVGMVSNAIRRDGADSLPGRSDELADLTIHACSELRSAGD